MKLFTNRIITFPRNATKNQRMTAAFTANNNNLKNLKNITITDQITLVSFTTAEIFASTTTTTTE